MPRLTAVLFAAAACVLGAACATDEPAPPAALAGAPYAESSCAACVDLACAEPIETCATDPECSAYLDCLRRCGVGASGNADAACEARCPRPNTAAGSGVFGALDDCRTGGLGANCQACGTGVRASIDDQDCPASMDPNPCFRCADEHCCESISACEIDVECTRFKRCIKTCGTDDCLLSCAEEHPAGLAKFTPSFACQFAHCSIWQTTCDPSGADPDLKCAYITCAEPIVRLMIDPFGYLAFACVLTSPDEVAACRDAYPTAQPLFDAWAECVAECAGP